MGTALLWPFQVWSVVLGFRQTPRGQSGVVWSTVAWSTIAFLYLLLRSAAGEMRRGAPPGWPMGQLVNADSFHFQCSHFFESSRQEKMPIVIPHDNYNDARPSSTDLIYIQSGCQEGVFLLCL